MISSFIQIHKRNCHTNFFSPNNSIDTAPLSSKSVPGPSAFAPQTDDPLVPDAFAPLEPHPHGTFSVKVCFFVFISSNAESKAETKSTAWHWAWQSFWVKPISKVQRKHECDDCSSRLFPNDQRGRRDAVCPVISLALSVMFTAAWILPIPALMLCLSCCSCVFICYECIWFLKQIPLVDI